MTQQNAFEERDLPLFETEAKVGLLATVTTEGSPHLTLITSLQGGSPQTLLFGQFSAGRSKQHLLTNPRAGFLILTMERRLWRGLARWTHSRKEGAEYEMYNQKPMFRYNAYFGIHTVHYLDLITTSGRESLPLGQIFSASVRTALAGKTHSVHAAPILKSWAVALFNALTSLKFITYINTEGYPVIIPLLQCRAASDRRLLFSPRAYKAELAAISPGTRVAVLALSMKATSVLVRGVFQGVARKRLLAMGSIDIDWVYNSMPPVPGQIYPPVALEPVINF